MYVYSYGEGEKQYTVQPQKNPLKNSVAKVFTQEYHRNIESKISICTQ